MTLHFRPEAVVFDNDGLLVDTESCWTKAEATIFAERGLEYPPAIKAEFIGKSVPDTVALMAQRFGEVGNEAAIGTRLLRLAAEVISAESVAMPGAVELVYSLRGRMPIAVASNSPRGLVEAALRPAGLWGRFDAVVSFDDVAIGKPAPDLYLKACAALAATPEHCLAFEDSETGLASARAAGLAVVGVPTLRNLEFDADLVVDSLADPDLMEWANSW
jgi:HAD superfamily hydrolase (TIGR01509 family)